MEIIIEGLVMALTKVAKIDGKDVTFRASAAVPGLYRSRFHRDIYEERISTLGGAVVI